LNRTFCYAGYTAEGSFTVWDTAEEKLPLWYHGKKVSSSWDTTQKNLSNILKLFCRVSNTGGKPLPLYYTLGKNLYRCIPKQRKNFSVVSHTAGKLKT
jgi:hypothetical protein